MIAACNDGFIRFFNLNTIKVDYALEGSDHNGVPLSFDFSPCKTMLAVTFEDDSFMTYHFSLSVETSEITVIRLMRGVGHKNFIQSVKFDKYF